LRFLNHDEAALLLKNLIPRSQQLYEMALLSLHCGLRAGEIFNLTWADVDMDRGILMLRPTFDTLFTPGRVIYFSTNSLL
jgi:integrase